MWRLSASARLGLAFTSALILLVGAVASGYYPGPFLVVLGPVSSVVLVACGSKLVERRVLPRGFGDLSRTAREVGLMAAWRWGSEAPSILPAYVLSAFAGLVLALAACLLFPGGRSDDNAEFHGAVAATWIFATSVWFGIGALAEYSFRAPVLRVRELRRLAAEWTNRWYPAWKKDALDLAEKHGCQRMHLAPPEASVFSLYEPGFSPPDMPPSRLRITVLVAGRYLAIRGGAYFDVYATSMLQGRSPTGPERGEFPVMGDESVVEREVHYRDIVSVDYRRVSRDGEVRGHFEVCLSGAAPFEFPTAEQGVSNAIEEVRRRTRAAKLGA